jgi:phosphoglycerol transferase
MTDPTARETSRLRRSIPAGPLATATLTLLGAFLSMELWKANLGAPLRYTQIDDSKFYFMLVKGIIDHGWYQHNGNLGAPFGQQLYDFPQGADNLNFLLIKLLAVFSSNWALVTNLFFLLTFPLTGLAAYAALRALDVSPAPATVCSVLFALVPYHFYRHESQVLLSAYYSVPLTAYVFICLVSGRPLFAKRSRAGPRVLARVSLPSVLTLATCVVIGSAGLYYAGFALVLLPAATIIAVLGGRGRQSLVEGLILCMIVGATLAVNLAPSIEYGARHGGNTDISRTPLESQQLGLGLSNLLLPVLGDRIPGLSKVSGKYATATSPGYCEACNEALGVVGASGFLVLCLVGLTALVGVAGATGGGRFAWQARFRPAALGVAVALGIGTIGGVSTLIAYFVTPDLRGWNRLSLFIAFFSLLAVGMLLDIAHRRLRARWERSAGAPGSTRSSGRRLGIAWAALLSAVLGLGTTDETSNFYLVNYSASAREYHSDQAFGRQIEADLPRGSNVFELPYVPFPEGYHVAGVPTVPSTGFSMSYEMLRPYLNTTDLNFSFAAVKGRPADWQAALSAKPLSIAVAGAAAAGFSGIYVDPRGYGTGAARVEAWLAQLTGVTPQVSSLHNAWFFDLRPYVRRLRASASPAKVAALRQATLNPLQVSCGPGPSQLELTNPGPRPARASLSATLENGTPGRIAVVIEFPGGAAEQRTLSSVATTSLRRRLILPPGTSGVKVLTAASLAVGHPKIANVVISNSTVTDAALTPFRSFRTAAGRTPPRAGLVAPSCALQWEASVPPA